MKLYDCIIFDMDGTLYPFNKICRTVYKDMAVNLIVRHYGTSPKEAEEQFVALRTFEEEKCGQRVSNTLVLLNNFDKVEFKDVEDEVNRIYHVEEVLEYDEKACEVVEKICEQYSTALYTMNNGETAHRTLNTIGMAELFPEDRRYTFSTMGKLDLPRAERIKHIKPGQPGYELVIRELGVNPENCLMVGDSKKSDIDPAQKLGMDGYLIKEFEDLYKLPGWLKMNEP